MSTKTSSVPFVPKKEFSLARNLHLSCISQKIVVSLWLMITLLSAMSWMLSLYDLKTYVLLNEPIWFACEAFFAAGLAFLVFRDYLLEGELG